jgi:hypothetical protein
MAGSKSDTFDSRIRTPTEPVSTRRWSNVWQVVVPGSHKVTVTKRPLVYPILPGPWSTTTTTAFESVVVVVVEEVSVVVVAVPLVPCPELPLPDSPPVSTR